MPYQFRSLNKAKYHRKTGSDNLDSIKSKEKSRFEGLERRINYKNNENYPVEYHIEEYMVRGNYGYSPYTLPEIFCNLFLKYYLLIMLSVLKV